MIKVTKLKLKIKIKIRECCKKGQSMLQAARRTKTIRNINIHIKIHQRNKK